MDQKATLIEFLAALDAHLAETSQPGQLLDLYQIGGAALVMHHASARATKDFDVVIDESAPLRAAAIAAFGKESARATQLGVYLDVVKSSLPPLPAGFRGRATVVPGPWKVIRVWILEPHDLIISKIRAFRSWDRQDIQFLCDQLQFSGRNIDPVVLRERFDSAFLWYTEGDPFRDDALTNLERVIAYLDGTLPSI